MPKRLRRAPWPRFGAARFGAAVLGAAVLGAGLLCGGAGSATAGLGMGAGAPAVLAETGTVAWSVRPSPAQGQSERANFSFEAKPNQRIEDSVRVRNFGRNPLPLTVYATDARTSQTAGVVELLAADEQPREVGRWISLEKMSLDIASGGFVDVPFTLTVPGDAGGDYTGGIVTSLNAAAPAGGSVLVDRRLGNLVQVRVDGPLRPELEVGALSAEYRGSANPAGKGEIRVSYTVENTGNVRMSAQQAVTASGPLGLDKRRVFLDPVPELLPGDSLTLTARMPGIAPTIRTSVEVELRGLPTRAGDQFGVEAIATSSTGIWSVPWTLLLLLSVLLVGPAATIGWRLRARDRGRGAGPRESRVALGSDDK